MKKQRFKGQTLTRTVIRNNILRVYDIAIREKDYKDWYISANRSAIAMAGHMGGETEANINIACGILAALSPRKRWENNLQLAWDAIINGEPTGHVEVFLDKAYKIMNCTGREEDILSILNGNKLTAFYLNIRYPAHGSVVTIDRHALSVALNRVTTDLDYLGMTTNQYQFFEQCYIWAAYKIGIRPSLLQSITWEWWRENKGNLELFINK